MTTEDDTIDRIRGSALDRIDRARRAFIALLVATAVIECACLVTYLVLMDFGNRVHLLILVGSVLVYMTLGVGLLTLGAYVGWMTQRVLKAVELLAPGDL